MTTEITGLLQLLHSIPTRLIDRPVLLGVGSAEVVAAGAIPACDEEEIGVLRRMQHRPHARCAGIADGAGRQTFVLVGIVRRWRQQIVMRDRARNVQPILHRRIGIELHADVQAIEIHASDGIALGRDARFGLHDRGKRHHFMQR
jgi:hypothetical protein